MLRTLAIAAALALAACGGVVEPPQPRTFPGDPPERLSDWGMLASDGRYLRVSDGVIAYDMNTALFTDYAHKLRTIWLPEGAQAAAHDDAVIDFPVGTVITKTFYYPRAGADPAHVALTLDDMPGWDGAGLDLGALRVIETRILVRRADGWAAFPYVWNEAQTEAVLRRIGELRRLTLVEASGETRPLAYLIPNTNQCAACHVTDAVTRVLAPIGPRPRHLNRDFAYADGVDNQLDRLIAAGWLTGLDDAGAAPRAARWTGREAWESLDLDVAARAWLDINCAHCHSPGGPARTSGLHLSPETPLGLQYGACKPPIAAGAGTGGRRFSIVPGQPEQSIFIYRLESARPAVMMPEIGRSTVHDESVELIARWIESLEGDCG
ncbi:MAG: hypothetical protein KIS81_01565 [Maricaulaceae bacterium]|nr:hypothetical protein [Maricaulaceae bacterium]